MKLFKNLFSRRSRREEALTKKESRVDALTNDPPIRPISPIRPIASPPPTSEDVPLTPNAKNAHPTASPRFTPKAFGAGGEGEQPSAEGANFHIDPDNKRNGKIAKLPRHLRDRINSALDAGQSVVSIAEQLNKLPEVKTILDTHFGGRPIKHQNLSEWKAGGYRDWQLRQELLHRQSELAADAHELGKTAEGMADSLYGMLMLEYVRLMKDQDKYTPEEYEKKRKDLSAWAQDVVRLRRCENQTRSVEVQEERLERDREKTSEEIFLKFMEWAANPEIRRTFILEPMVCMALQRRHFGLPPRPEDAAVLKEYGAKTDENHEMQTECKPPPTENSEAPASPPPPSEDVTLPSPTEKAGSVAVPSPLPSDGRGDLSRLGSGERNLAEPKADRPSERERASQRQGEVRVSSIRPICPISPITPSPTSEDVATHSDNKNSGPVASSRFTPKAFGAGGEGQDEGGQITNSKFTIQNSTLSKSPEPDPNDGLSRLYAVLTPTPEILEERKRRHEELCRQAAANREARQRQSQLGIPSPSPLDSISEPCYPHAPKPPQPGFSPPPAVPFPYKSVFNEIHHPSDNWKLQTS